MDLGLKGRTAIVTGASSGLGLASAEALAGEGANVTLVGRRRELLEREAERIGGLAVRGDVTVPPRPRASRRDDARGVRRRRRPRLERGRAAAGDSPRRHARVARGGARAPRPARGPSRRALPPAPRAQPRRSHRGAHVARGEGADGHLALSNALRPAVTGWLKTLAAELGPKGITVNCVAPGRIATARLEQLYPDGPTESAVADIPLRRWGRPRELGDVVCFLASDRARYVTGQTILVDGGLQRALF